MRNITIINKDQERRELTIERIVAIPAKLAWQGWTEPEHIIRWWGPRSWTTTVYEMDVRPEGIWRYSLKPDDGNGEEAFCRAVYHEVSEPARLVYTDSFANDNWDIVEGSDMLTTVTFWEVPEGTRLRIITRFAATQDIDKAEATGMVEGYTDALERLDEYLKTI